MLRTLRIRNFAIVDTIDFDARPGLTVFTGETGAGKTIIVEAIRFLLGGRASSEMIRTGADTAVVEGLFDDLPPSVQAELPESATESIWLRREMVRGGATRCFLDDRQVTRTILQKIGAQLADLCGQHQQQQLLDPARHIDLLDESAGADDQIAQVRQLYNELTESRRELQALRAEIARLREQEELRRFQIAEIRTAAVEPDEDERLKGEIEILRNARRLSETAERALAVLSDEDDAVSVALGRLLRDA
ncbi:MAG TPA: AAA family ATPase, partial [Acidobacteriota bacterium]|nr:AAA family ATPase [Acidobacteriota bacterium]